MTMLSKRNTLETFLTIFWLQWRPLSYPLELCAGLAAPFLRQTPFRTPLAQLRGPRRLSHIKDAQRLDPLPKYSRLGPAGQTGSTGKKAFKAPRTNRRFEPPLHRGGERAVVRGFPQTREILTLMLWQEMYLLTSPAN